MARHARDELEGRGAPPGQAILHRLKGDNVTFTLEGNAVKVESADDSEIRFELTDVPCQGSELTVLIQAKAMPRRGYPSEYARLMVASVEKGLPFPSPMALEAPSGRQRSERTGYGGISFCPGTLDMY